MRETRKVSRLDVSSLRQAGNLGRLGKLSRRLSPWLLAIDLSRRLLHVRDLNHADGNWQREMFVETGGFIGATSFGTASTGLSLGVIGGALIITRSPALTVAIGAGAVEVTAEAIETGDRRGREAAGQLYDRVAKLFRR